MKINLVELAIAEADADIADEYFERSMRNFEQEYAGLYDFEFEDWKNK